MSISAYVHILDSDKSSRSQLDWMLCGISCKKAPADIIFPFVLEDDDGRTIATCKECCKQYDTMKLVRSSR